jgi:phage shock protein PspC (stress-responsive transcriptional regulator)
VNKVVSIEIAGQVFWIEDAAYETLMAYLKKIRQQLAGEEDAKEIVKDIELRIAELLYGFASDDKKAITGRELDQVIEQIGFIDDEEAGIEVSAASPRKTYRDMQNKILAGVCSGIALRYSVPAFIVRLIFLALTFAFGLGVMLYLIFWFSLDANDSRRAALAAQGQTPTARRIAEQDTPRENPFIQLQRIIFLPISILGALVTVFGDHFKRRRDGYVFLFKNLVAAALIFLAFIGVGVIVALNQAHIFPRVFSWILSAGGMYLMVLIFTIYIREYYMKKPRARVSRQLKLGALVPVAMIVLAIGYTTFAHKAHEHERVEHTFALEGDTLQLDLLPFDDKSRHSYNIRYSVETADSDDKTVKLIIDYSSDGKNIGDAKENLQSIDYVFNFNGDTLSIGEDWALKAGTYQRGQSVEVLIQVPQNVRFESPRRLRVDHIDKGYRYYTYWYNDEGPHAYIASGDYIHEFDEDHANRLSENERHVLRDKFCDEFFISESWACINNVRTSVDDNRRFDRAFEKDSASIDQLREFLLSDRSLFVTNLREMDEIVQKLSVDYPVMNKFGTHINHLLEIKTKAQQ